MAFSAAEIVCWQYEVVWSAKEMNRCVVEQARKGVSKSRDNWPYGSLTGFESWVRGCFDGVERRGRWFLWLVWWRHGDRWDLKLEALRTGVEGWDAVALMLWFVVLRDGAGKGANG